MAKNLTVRLDDQLAADTEAIARAEGTSLNETVKQALVEAVERRREDPEFRERHAHHRAGPRPARTTREVTTLQVDLVDCIAIAAELTGMDAATIAGLPNLSLADSALHAPFAGFGDHEFYPEFVDKDAVLIERLARNHPLPDGNKRAAWVTLRVFVEINELDLAAVPVRR
ncbi:MAG: type II toxin-antitoxin system death-on-curing family toxin [Solirubrobacteraceae bacterium]